MKILVIGLGSMGKRRIRLLKELDNIELFGIDKQESRRSETRDSFGINCYSSIREAVEKELPEAAIVCTSPLSHSSLINECLNNHLHVFSEINLVSDGYDKNLCLAKAEGKVLFLSSTFLYRSETQAIIEKVHQALCPLNYIYHIGQYLPDWHPWESYNSFFIGDPRTNGCREILAIELPWIITAFGPIIKVSAVKSKNTELEIHYNDNYLITIEHQGGHKGVLAVDVVTRKPIRHIDVYGESLQLSWNGTPNSLIQYNPDSRVEEIIRLNEDSEHLDGYAEFISENPYRNELMAFLKQISQPEYDPIWNFERDREVLRIIDQIEAE